MFKKILCPVDLSENSLRAISVARELARAFGGKLILLHVCEQFMNKDEMVMLRVNPNDFLELEKKVASKAKRIMEEELQRSGAQDLPHELILREGKPFKEIVSLGEELAVDLIVITTNGRTGVGEKLLGSTAEHVVRYSRVPVLTLRVG